MKTKMFLLLLMIVAVSIVHGQNNDSSLYVNVIYPLKVDYNKSLKEMITLGKYDVVNNNVIKYWESSSLGTKKGVVELSVKIFSFKGPMSVDELKKLIKTNHLSPATLEELLSFRIMYPRVSEELAIFAIGSDPQDQTIGSRPCIYYGVTDDLGLPGPIDEAKVAHYGNKLGLDGFDVVEGTYFVLVVVEK